MMFIFFLLYIFIFLLTYALCKAASKDEKYTEIDKEKKGQCTNDL